MDRIGVLLINLGTPDAPTPAAVGRYLREFLMDPYVINLPAPLRWFLVNVIIVPRRKHQSAKLYQRIHTASGSPLLTNTRALANELARELADRSDAFVVEFAMRYGSPPIESELTKLFTAKVSQVVVAPLYPQYAESSFETAVRETRRVASRIGGEELLSFMPPFYDRPDFIKVSANSINEYLKQDLTEHVLFSFHSLPVKQVKRLDPTRQHCSVKSDCCDQITDANRNCYRAQCVFTARAIARELGLSEESYTISFQSRLGRAEWLGPQTESVLRELAVRGIKNVAVCCPSFVADCLETLEEIAIRGRKTFLDAGGAQLKLIPALNSDPRWIETLANWIESAAQN